jgi:SHS2 domain-containing protein
MKQYEVIEHTADIGLRIYGRDLQELFRHAALGLFNLMTDVGKIKTQESRTFCLQSQNAGNLLLSWLRELLFTFSVEKWVFKEIVFKNLTERQLEAIATGERFDPKRHEQRSEVKAVTYHQFKLEKRKTGWVAEVIFDI